MLRLKIKIEPRGQGRPRFARATGRAYTPASTRAYTSALRSAMVEHMAGRQPLDGPLAISVSAVFSRPKSDRKRRWHVYRPDADNILKGVLDAANGVMFLDDCQIVTATVRKRYGENDTAPCVYVTLRRET